MGLELAVDSDKAVISAGDGLDVEVKSLLCGRLCGRVTACFACLLPVVVSLCLSLPNAVSSNLIVLTLAHVAP